MPVNITWAIRVLTQADITLLSTKGLRDILLHSPNPELCNQVSWAMAELRRRRITREKAAR
jgi:hypothetical protein